MPRPILTYGDPVLKSKAAPITEIDGKVIRMVESMFASLDATDNGLALAAPQIGLQRQIIVWDLDEDPQVLLNPQIVEADGEWVYDEGCLSIPGLYAEMLRPNRVLVRAVTLDGNEVELEADELLGRMFQHEIDHLNGVLMFDRMSPDQRRLAVAEYRRLQENPQRAGEARRLTLQ